MTSEQVWTVLLALEAVDPDLANPAVRSAFDTLAAEWVRLKHDEREIGVVTSGTQSPLVGDHGWTRCDTEI